MKSTPQSYHLCRPIRDRSSIPSTVATARPTALQLFSTVMMSGMVRVMRTMRPSLSDPAIQIENLR